MVAGAADLLWCWYNVHNLPWNKGRPFPDYFVPLLPPEPQEACKAIHVRSGVLRGYPITRPEALFFLFEAVLWQPSGSANPFGNRTIYSLRFVNMRH